MRLSGITAAASLIAACTQAPAAPAAQPTAKPASAAPTTAPAKPAAKAPAAAAAKPTTPAEIFNYTGPDRAQILEEGARREGAFSWYTTTTHNPAIKAAFEQSYPYLTVEVFRADSGELIRKTLEEYGANVREVDVFETTTDAVSAFKKAQIVQPFTSPEASAFPDSVKDPDRYYIFNGESYQSLGYNTNLVSEEELPNSHQDYLDPKWKGKMAIPGSSTGVRFIGSMVLLYGEDFVRQLAANDLRVVQVSGRALSDMVIAGEFPLSPTIFDSHVTVSSGEGAPFAWKPIEPVVVNTRAPMLATQPPNPHAAMLFVDWLLSKEGAEVYQSRGFYSPRTDMSDTPTFGKHFLEREAEDYEAEYVKWQELRRILTVQQ